MNMNSRFNILYELAQKAPGLGKTAMMKYLFLLQQVYKVPLDYNFEIYTYGPYSSEVMEDMDFAKRQNIISMEAKSYEFGIAYSINANDYDSFHKDSDSPFKTEISELLRFFGHRTAKELELLTTIVYLYRNSRMNAWDCSKETIANDVYEIKPHFSLDDIKNEYENLDRHGILKKAI